MKIFDKKIGSYLWVTPVVAILVILLAYPIFRTVQLSFYDYRLTDATHSFIGMEGYKKTMELRVSLEDEKSGGGDSKRNAVLSIKLKLKKLGEIEIKIKKWENNLDLIFIVDEKIDKKLILKNIEALKKNLEAQGFKLLETSVKHRFESENPKYQGVNIKI